MGYTTDYRFQVGCKDCGYLDGFPNKQAAVNYAQAIYDSHNDCSEGVTIYDLMAHKGKNNLFDRNGIAIGKV